MTNTEIQQSVDMLRALKAELEKQLEEIKRSINPFGPDFSPEIERKFNEDFYVNVFNSITDVEDFLIDTNK
jgi:hypothetical protein